MSTVVQDHGDHIAVLDVDLYHEILHCEQMGDEPEGVARDFGVPLAEVKAIYRDAQRDRVAAGAAGAPVSFDDIKAAYQKALDE